MAVDEDLTLIRQYRSGVRWRGGADGAVAGPKMAVGVALRNRDGIVGGGKRVAGIGQGCF